MSADSTETKRVNLEKQLEKFVVSLGNLQRTLDNSPERLHEQILEVPNHLKALDKRKDVRIAVPMEIFDYLDQDQNPDLYTSQQLTSSVYANEDGKGMVVSFENFSQILDSKIEESFPGLTSWYNQKVNEDQDKIELPIPEDASGAESPDNEDEDGSMDNNE